MRMFQVLALLIAAGFVLAGCETDPGWKHYRFHGNWREDILDAKRFEEDANELARQGKYREAASIYLVKVLPLYERMMDSDHPIVAERLAIVADFYQRQNRHAEADEIIKRALPILEKEDGPDHHTVGKILLVQAASYIGQGRFAEAEPLLKRALAIVENTDKKYGPNNPFNVWSRDRLRGLRERLPIAAGTK